MKPKTSKAVKKAAARSEHYPRFHINRHYNDMTRAERREYKRWLTKHKLWDGAVAVESMEREKKISGKPSW
jgi:hypothetical protein